VKLLAQTFSALNFGMQTPTIRRLYCLAGPLFAIALVAFSVLGHGGPGFFFLSLAGACLFMFVTPLVQAFLLNTEKCKDRHGAACAAALLVTLMALCFPIFLGLFNFH
jgi:hypothetical protein